MAWTADFETTTDKEDCRVWAWACYEIETEKITTGIYIDTFMLFLSENPGTYYFHNERFDGEFIFNWLFRNEYTLVKKETGQPAFKVKLEEKQFTCVMDDMGKLYSISIRVNGKTTRIFDSLKIIPLSVDKIAKSFGLPISKLSIDYNEKREIGHLLTQEEHDYISNDVRIVGLALKSYFNLGLTKTTQASNALADYKKIVGKEQFERDFPQLGNDADLRRAYKGAWTYANPKYAGKDIGEGIVLDVNSLYPYVMTERPLPYGFPVYFEGEYEPDDLYPLYIQKVTFNFDLKENHFPCIQLKNNPRFCPVDYLETDDDVEVTMTVTNVEWELIQEQYHVTNPEYHEGWKFKASSDLFTEYIKKWAKIKIESDDNPGWRQIAKLMMNALYGKFGKNPMVRNKWPYLGEDGVVHFTRGDPELEKPLYIPVAAFITAWARDYTTRAAQLCYDRFLYADTDSLHLIGTEEPDFLPIHKTKLGCWKHESDFSRARYIRAKTYIEEIDGKLSITVAGMPKSCYPQVTWENFHVGAIYTGKLVPRHVPGGQILEETTFCISP